MSESATLASSSSTVKVWQASTTSLELKWATDSHEGTPIHALEWNNNGEFIISSGEYGHLVMEHGKTGVSLASLEVPSKEPHIPTHVLGVSLSRGSRFLCCGGTDCLVSTFDFKEKKRIRTFRGHRDTVTSVAFTAKEDHVASGSLSGEILLHSMIRDSSVATLKPKLFSATSSIDYAVTKIAFSPYNPYSLVSAMESGGVTLWDVAKRIESYSCVAAHTAPTTSIAFSPINKLLFCTGGLDKRFCFFDSKDKK
jgi:WD40 repeat protein